jgi:hypothetical protein
VTWFHSIMMIAWRICIFGGKNRIIIGHRDSNPKKSSVSPFRMGEKQWDYFQ